jgi:uncharacterized hydrophobic protein (TIGR00271 family)
LDDYDKIHETIERDIIFKGTNLWILIFAIVVASVGLNMNSTAVIIGAMLISPLMGPINGMGYSIATYNFTLFHLAFKNYMFAVVAGLVASTLYFSISPLSTAHSELLARTSPSIYDVIIALFGGLAGILAISSRQKGNVIPGVAIATALMPPLCTAGYGLATAQFEFFFGALYLFTINTVFIAISAVAISQIMKFPIRTLVDEVKRKRINRWITIVIIVTLVPSIYFGYLLVQKEQFVERASRYVDNVNVYSGNYLLDYFIDPSKKTITLTYGGSSFSEEEITAISGKVRDFRLRDASVVVKQGLSFDSLKQQLSETENLASEVKKLSLLVKGTEQQRHVLQENSFMGRQLLAESKSLFDGIVSCSYSEARIFHDSLPEGLLTSIVIFGVDLDGKPVIPREDVKRWLEARLQSPKVRVYFEQ